MAAQIAGRIRTRRKAKKPKLSQEGLARRANLSMATVYRAERGKGIPEWPTLEAIADALGCTLFDLLPPPDDTGSRARAGYFTLDHRILHDPFTDAPSSHPERVYRARLVSDVLRPVAA